MSGLFAEMPEAITNTLLIAERCNVDLSRKGYHLPTFPLPADVTTDQQLRRLCEEGIQKRFGDKQE